MNDRTRIKWAPFSSVINGEIIVNNIENKRKKVLKPILSEEQLESFNNIIIDSYQCLSKVWIEYYNNGYIYNIRGIITTIDKVHKRILINAKLFIYFSQIIMIRNE